MKEAPEDIWLTIAGYDPDPQYDVGWTTAEPGGGIGCVKYLRADVALPFVVLWATRYAEDHGRNAMHLHPDHYDLLARCGARMVEFKRWEETPENANKIKP